MRSFRFDIILALLTVLCAGAISGCSSGVRSVCADVDPRGWRTEDVKSMKYENGDTTSLRDIVFFLSCDRSITDDISFEITTVTPDSLRFFERFIFDPSQAENGGDFTVRRMPYRSSCVLDRKGGYVFRVRQLEGAPLRGVRAVGIEVKEK